MAGGVVDYGGGGEMIFCVARFEFGAAGGQDVLDPVAVWSVGEGYEESFGSAKDVDWSAVAAG